MLDIKEAKTAAKASYLQAASMSGFEVSAHSPERFVEMIEKGFSKVEANRRPEAVANILKIIAATLEIAQKNGDTSLGEGSVDAAKEQVCPVCPFD